LEYLITHEKARQRRAISLTLLSKLGCGEAQHPILAIGSNNDPAPGRVGLVESKSASFLNDFNGISGETADSRCAYRKSSPSILVMQSTEDRTAKNSPPPPPHPGHGHAFTNGERYFIVTAAHILKEDEDDPSSVDIDLTAVAYPTGLLNAKPRTLGNFSLHRPGSPSRVDVAILELHDAETIETLKTGWRFLDLDAVAPFPFNARFVVTGFLHEGVKWDGNNVGQRFLKLTTDPLHYVPETAGTGRASSGSVHGPPVRVPGPHQGQPDKDHLLDGTGFCLFTKRLEQGVFLWPPSVKPDETLSLTSAQLSSLIEGVDWRALEQRWRPAIAGCCPGIGAHWLPSIDTTCEK
jgi:hypothetical protein